MTNKIDFRKLGKAGTSGRRKEIVSFFQRNPGAGFSENFVISTLSSKIKSLEFQTHDIANCFFQGYILCLDFDDLVKIFKENSKNINKEYNSRIFLSKEEMLKREQIRCCYGCPSFIYFSPPEEDILEIKKVIDDIYTSNKTEFFKRIFSYYFFEKYLCPKKIVRIEARGAGKQNTGY